MINDRLKYMIFYFSCTVLVLVCQLIKLTLSIKRLLLRLDLKLIGVGYMRPHYSIIWDYLTQRFSIFCVDVQMSKKIEKTPSKKMDLM